MSANAQRSPLACYAWCVQCRRFGKAPLEGSAACCPGAVPGSGSFRAEGWQIHKNVDRCVYMPRAHFENRTSLVKVM
jgi:hypothetical protein